VAPVSAGGAGGVPSRTLVLGGVRSGKSSWAEGLLAGAAEVTYAATAPQRPDDAEWATRLAVHRARRPAGWAAVETAGAVVDLPRLVASAPAGSALLVDDVGSWLTLALDSTGAWEHPEGAARVREDADALVAAVAACRARLVLVSPEVGLAVVPATHSGRVFADAQGTLNGRLAAGCDEVVLVVAGLALRLKAPGTGG